MQGTVAKAVAATGRGHFGQPNRRVPPRSCGVQMRGELVISGDWLCPATVTSDDGHVSRITRGWRRIHTDSSSCPHSGRQDFLSAVDRLIAETEQAHAELSVAL